MNRLELMMELEKRFGFCVTLGETMGVANVPCPYNYLGYIRAEWVMIKNWRGMRGKVVRLIPKKGVPIYDYRSIIEFGA